MICVPERWDPKTLRQPEEKSDICHKCLRDILLAVTDERERAIKGKIEA